MIYDQDFLADTSDESLFAELRRVADSLKKDSVTEAELDQHGRVKSSTIKKRFGKWNTALEKSGLRVGKRMNIPDRDIFAEIGRVWSLLGHRPSREEFDDKANYSSTLLKKRFGGYRKALGWFLQHQGEIDQHQEAPGLSSREKLHSGLTPSLSGRSGSRRYGELINFRGILLHAPVNEQGVVFLFGILAKELGFIVEGIYQGFPDCEAKRRDKNGDFRRVTIEFEFRSSAFRKDHYSKGQRCDLIVCWTHDWPACLLEVIELSREVEKLSDRA